MDKLYGFELLIRGNTKDQAPSIITRYQDEAGAQRIKVLDTEDLNRVLFSSGVEGELWFDLFSGIETFEGIGVEE